VGIDAYHLHLSVLLAYKEYWLACKLRYIRIYAFFTILSYRISCILLLSQNDFDLRDSHDDHLPCMPNRGCHENYFLACPNIFKASKCSKIAPTFNTASPLDKLEGKSIGELDSIGRPSSDVFSFLNEWLSKSISNTRKPILHDFRLYFCY